ncbi:transmembrane protein, putative (macronuclear) [Tetrahymena thermophila SB210]|uniref:Transmembrane protein, putative n=1 Tax=Tetrahymena thermophila (strain SB210) TaxID=312017 RepID=W7XIU7_TETTS|nr:transmembrane protein, putative [Tetrahymena thermophila SB210]EWS74931.1 transmembrane protein, putative [Tetrahymena thermophila SB210]|eukprot:XP_012652520.1 transmembrane protein, putative [Tetrahymena thermophila SB210]
MKQKLLMKFHMLFKSNSSFYPVLIILKQKQKKITSIIYVHLQLLSTILISYLFRVQNIKQVLTLLFRIQHTQIITYLQYNYHITNLKYTKLITILRIKYNL